LCRIAAGSAGEHSFLTNLELPKLGRFLDDDVALIVGGRKAAAYESVLIEIGAIILLDPGTLRSELEAFRFGSRLGGPVEAERPAGPEPVPPPVPA